MTDRLENIPKALQERRNWIVWKLEDRGGPKPTKTPYSVTGARAKVNDPDTWATFEEAVAACGQYDGIGFVFTGTPFVGIDIDGCIDPLTGEISPEARDVLSIQDSYTETSQSGLGYHIIIEGQLPDGRRRNGAFEMYGDSSPRYFAMTGNVVGDRRDIRADQDAIDAIHAAYIQPQQPSNGQGAPQERRTADVDLLDRIRASSQGAAFSSLWEGDTSAHGGDESAADLALCNMLAFWTSRNAVMMDELFRQSKLYRPKWDERRGAHTYGEMTIARAIQDCKEVYRPTPGDDFREPLAASAPAPATIPQNPLKLQTISARDLQAQELPPLVFVVDEILPQGLAILAAPSKYGKSWLSLDLCLTVAAGRPFMGYSTPKAGTLYLALEDGYRRLKGRIETILQGAPAPDNFFMTTAANTIDTGLSDQIAGHLKDHPDTKLVIIDVLERVRSAGNRRASAYTLDYQDMGALKSIADRNGVCVLVIHHTRKMKDEADVYNAISGTTGVMGACDTIWVMQREKREDAKTHLNIIGRDCAEQNLVIEMDQCRWRKIGTVEEEAAWKARQDYEQDPVVKTIKALLAARPLGFEMSASDFMMEMGQRVGEYGGHSPVSLGKHFPKIAYTLLDNDGIVYIRPRTTRDKKHGFKPRGGPMLYDHKEATP